MVSGNLLVKTNFPFAGRYQVKIASWLVGVSLVSFWGNLFLYIVNLHRLCLFCFLLFHGCGTLIFAV